MLGTRSYHVTVVLGVGTFDTSHHTDEKTETQGHAKITECVCVCVGGS